MIRKHTFARAGRVPAAAALLALLAAGCQTTDPYTGQTQQNRTGTGYNVYVRLQDGRETVAMQDDLGDIRVGSYVRVVNGRAYLQ